MKKIKLQKKTMVKKNYRNLKSPYISISLANALRTITILFYPDHHYQNF